MALRDPVAVYNAANNVEAHLIRNALLAADVEAHVTEDNSQVGTWIGGLIPEIHKPQVWIERADIDRAKSVLAEFERRSAQLRETRGEVDVNAPPIEVNCPECDTNSTFPASQRGSVQQCPKCGEYLDVGEADLPDGWDETEVEPDAP